MYSVFRITIPQTAHHYWVLVLFSTGDDSVVRRAYKPECTRWSASAADDFGTYLSWRGVAMDTVLDNRRTN